MSVSYPMIVAAAAAGFVFSAVYYTTLGSHWLRALGSARADAMRNQANFAVNMVINALAQLLMAWIFAGLLLHLAKSGVPASLRNGLLSGAFCWAGFVLTTLTTNHRFQGASWRLTLIDSAHWLGVLMIQGAILGAFAVRA